MARGRAQRSHRRSRSARRAGLSRSLAAKQRRAGPHLIVLDENIPEDQCEWLRRWRTRFRQIGHGLGQQGMKDEHILPLLHELDRPTFFTRDLGFADTNRCHQHYALVCLAVAPNEVARVIKRIPATSVLQHQEEAHGQRDSRDARGLLVSRFHAEKEHRVAWPE